MLRFASPGWRLGIVLIGLSGLGLSPAIVAQTFDVNGQSSPPQSSPPGKKGTGHPSNHDTQQSNNETGMGWGQSIEVAREARAAQTDLQRGDARSAVGHAQRAVDAAPQNPDLWFTLAYASRLSGQYFQSVAAYQRGLQLRPSSVEGLSGLAQTYAKMGRSADAQKTVELALASNPKSDTDLQLAGELLLTTDPQRAIGYLQRSEAVKSSARTELLLARAYQRTDDSDSARKMLERARRSAPTNPEVLRAVASYYRDTGDYQSAIRILGELHAKDSATLAELGYSFALAGDTKNAARAYGEAAQRAPGEIEIQLNAVQAMLNAGELDQATRVVKHAEDLDPQHYRLFALRARLDAMEHRPEDAIRDYEAALAHLPQGVPEGVLYPVSLRVDLAQLYRDSERNEEADRLANDAANTLAGLDITGPNRPEFLRLRAATEVQLRKTDAAKADLEEALQIEPKNGVLLLNYANLLWKLGDKEDARKTYLQALAIDPSSPGALGALGFLAREMADSKAAQDYFEELAKKHPDDYVPYLALGDLHSANRDFTEAQRSYEQAYQRAPSNPLIVSGAMNAALEAHHTDLAKEWLVRASETIRHNPQVMREHERYLTMTGQYAESAQLGYKVIEKLPKDREAADYLAYDLLFLKRDDEAMKIVERYKPVLTDDRDLWLISGYIHAGRGDNETAVLDFTRALEIDPQMAVGYMNRGYVYNDMRLATKAESDFRKALELNPNYGEAHLGLAYALLQLRRSTAALKEAEAASRSLPDSESLHLAMAEAYRQRVMLVPAEEEYRKALSLNASSPTTYLALADVQYRAHKYSASADTLRAGLSVASNDPMISAELARSYAELGRTAEAMNAIETAEKLGGRDYKVLLVTADALRIEGKRDDAMKRYSRALESADNRLEVRLALARLFADEGKPKDAQQQVALGFAEARVAPVDVTSADDYLNGADILMSIHEYALAQRLYGRAQALGADDTAVAVGMANASLALGDTRSAELQLASLPADADRENNFDFLVAQGNVYRQRGNHQRALQSFARANQLDPDDPGVRQAELELAEEEGRPITDRIGMNSGVLLHGLFEDENIYQMDARLRGVQDTPSLLPPPRRSIETFADSRFQFRPSSFPEIQGFVAERNARGNFSFPSELLIQQRNTFDTIFNGSVAPVVNVGDVKVTVNPGLQYTIRRDTLAPTPMNQNLFRQFLYVSTSPIGNWLSFSGDIIREAGPFTEQDLHSRDFSGALDFRVGRPWGKTALLTGYFAEDLLFGPSIHEYYQTLTYAGVERQFGSRIRASAVAEFRRAWRVEGSQYAIGQALRPRFSLDTQINRHWSVSALGAWSSGRSFHDYDSVTSSFVVSYMHERRTAAGAPESASIAYPMRFSFGFDQQTFYDFPGHTRTQVVPVARFTF